MLTHTAQGDSRLSLWLHVRRFAVPPSMIENATARRCAGDWAAACAAAGVDVDLNLRVLARTHGRELAARIRADLRHLAPDLLRWHMPRIAPDGLLRPGLTITLARYGTAEQGGVDGAGGVGPVHLVARTPPAWADAGQRISLALWDGVRPAAGAYRHPQPRPHPHPHPDRRFRLDLHRHLWDARRVDELRVRCGAGIRARTERLAADRPDPLGVVPWGRHCAVERWADEAATLLRAEGLPLAGGVVGVRLGARHRLELELAWEPGLRCGRVLAPDGDGGPDLDAYRHGAGPPTPRIRSAASKGGASALPLLPDAATWVPPDLELLRAGLIGADQLHPLVASALVPEHASVRTPRGPDGVAPPHLVACRAAEHRIALVNGVLTALDHDPAEIRREELLAALTGTPLPCLRVIHEADRHPDFLAEVRARLDHGDTAGALAVVERLLGPDTLPRRGPLRDELEVAALRHVTHGLFRAGLVGAEPRRDSRNPRRHREHRTHPRQAMLR